jgi:hypothetical protein
MSSKLTKRYSSTISIKWIDEQISYLNAKLGIYKPDAAQEFFFEPTGGFYGFIAQGRIDALNEAMRMLSNHISSRTAPVIEDWDSADYLSTLDHDFTSDEEIPGLIKYVGPHHSRIKLGATNKHSPFVLGAILAHELTHHFLLNKGVVYDDINENERLTDLATVYLGLGKLTLNGYEPVTWKVKRKEGEVTYTYKVGYLTSMDMAMILDRVCSFRHIPMEYTEINLAPSTAELRESLFRNRCSP